ncbi:MAG TPA: SHOCT domain-containing protein [Solirubrobacterales bacterium]|nr:SHOCT domain-containing protein [Solirubrobacterales bacterium]
MLALAVVSALVLAASPAGATPQEEQQGSRLLQELEAGQLKCSDAAAADFELVGEYAMGRRFSGCGGGQLRQGFGQMMGAVNAMGMMGGGMMGGVQGDGRSYGGSMMGGGYGYSSSNQNDEGFDGPSAGAMIGMMAVLIGAVALALFLLARWRPGGPLETLKRRYASGELSAEEFQERKRLLAGS